MYISGRVGIFLDVNFVWLTTRTMHPHPMGRTWGEPGEIELTPMGVELNGSRRAPLGSGGCSTSSCLNTYLLRGYTIGQAAPHLCQYIPFFTWRRGSCRAMGPRRTGLLLLGAPRQAWGTRPVEGYPLNDS